jgi:hypothetical protein
MHHLPNAKKCRKMLAREWEKSNLLLQQHCGHTSVGLNEEVKLSHPIPKMVVRPKSLVYVENPKVRTALAHHPLPLFGERRKEEN